MNIEFPVIIVGIIVFGLFVIPIFMASRSTRKKEQRLTSAFEKAVGDHSLHISERDDWRGRILGYDSQKRTILFVKRSGDEIYSVVTGLSSVQNIHLSVNEKDDIMLTLALKNGQEENLSFYASSEDFSTDEAGFKHLANKWKALLIQSKNTQHEKKVSA